MKTLQFMLLPLASLAALSALAQGSFLYDQQSSTDETPPPFGSGGAIQQLSPGLGQSFTPTLSSVGFVRLKLAGNTAFAQGATMLVNLWGGSLGGQILGSTEPVHMATGFSGVEDFIFSTPVSLTPGTVYYLEPVVVSGGLWNITGGPFNYPGGMAFYLGQSYSGSDLWFREGIIVPEPSTAALAVLEGLASLWLVNRRRTP